jgi:hypothetical protein
LCLAPYRGWGGDLLSADYTVEVWSFPQTDQPRTLFCALSPVSLAGLFLVFLQSDWTPLCSPRAFASSTLARRDAPLWALTSAQRGHSHALAPLRRYSFQPTVTASKALPEREPPSNHALGALRPCEILSHVSSNASRPAPILTVLIPMRIAQ